MRPLLPLLLLAACTPDPTKDPVDTDRVSVDTSDTADTSDTNDTADTSDTAETDSGADTDDTDSPADTDDTDSPADTDDTDSPADTDDTDSGADTDDTDSGADTDDTDSPADTDDTDSPADTDDTDAPPGRTSILLGEFCLNEPTLGPGSYQGSLASTLNDFSVGCGQTAAGREGSVKVEVGAGQTLTVSYRATGADAVLYVLDTCPVMSSCVASADSTGDGGLETASWTNQGGTTATVHVFLDAFDSLSGGAFELDLSIQ